MKVLLIGGSKSGKSMLAQRLAKMLAGGGPLVYWATMEPTDGEDLARIARHREERAGWGFRTVERGRSLGSAAQVDPTSTVLFDSVTALFTNELFGGERGKRLFSEGVDAAALAAEAEAQTVSGLIALAGGVQSIVAVADDVFRAGEEHEYFTALWLRGYADVLRKLAAEFDAVAEVCGGEIRLHKGDPGLMRGYR